MEVTSWGELMDKKKLVALGIIILLLAGVLTFFALGASNKGDNDDITRTSAYQNITVYCIQNGISDKRDVDGSTLKEILSNAVNGIEFNTAGQVSSVNGVRPGTDQKWVMWVWSNAKWSSISSVTDDVKLHNGSDLALTLSDMVVNNGVYSYADPGFPILQKVWFFVKFVNDSEANTNVTSYLSKGEREAGVWVRGEGIDAVYALKDVAVRLGWNLSIDMQMTPRGWLNSFFGLSDVYNVSNGNWTYWSQYHWDGKEWAYDQSVLGGYDISEVCYFALVRQTTEEKGVNFNWSVTPNDIPASLLT